MSRRESIQFGFANAIMDTTVGGLILCGMNEGVGESTIEGDERAWLPWTPYFSHEMNKCTFQTTVKEWFRCWGHPLDPECPTELDWAIAQTNLFIDFSKTFEEIVRTDDNWVTAIDELADVAIRLKASGVIFLSKKLGDDIAWYVNRDKFALGRWRETFGHDLSWDEPRYGRLNFRLAPDSRILLANVSHPNYKVAYDDVSESKVEMGPWINQVLAQWRNVQKKTPTGG